MLMEVFEQIWNNSPAKRGLLASKSAHNGLWAFLPEIAAAKGYTKKTVGAFDWSKGTARVGRDIKLIRFKGYRDGKLQVYETGVGCYELAEADVQRLLENHKALTAFL